MPIAYFPPCDDERPAMGLKTLDLKNWIERDSGFSKMREKKQKLLRDHYDQVVQIRSEAEPGVIELHETLGEHLAVTDPQTYQYRYGEMSCDGERYPPPSSARQALEQITTWTQEDWALLSPQAPVTLEAGSICFPSRWSLLEKIGQDMMGIHQPVPRFQPVAKAARSFIEQIVVERPMWRLNWTIHDSDELFCPGPHPAAADLNVNNIFDRSYFRVERQTLRRLPKSRAVVFSIRTYVNRMREVVAEPGRKSQLLRTITGLSHETASYKGMAAFAHLLKTALEDSAGDFIRG